MVHAGEKDEKKHGLNRTKALRLEHGRGKSKKDKKTKRGGRRGGRY